MMWNRKELKVRGKSALHRNYGTAVFVTILMGIISFFSSGNVSVNYSGESMHMWETMPHEMRIFSGILAASLISFGMIGMLLKILVENVLIVGGSLFFVKNQTERPGVDMILSGFRSGHYGNIVKVMFLKDIKLLLWSLLLIVPGIIKGYEYKMIPYILAENPAMDRESAFKISKSMMQGQKMEAFILDLSFFGWLILGSLLCGLPLVFYVRPYMEATYSEMYTFNKMKAYQEGTIR